MSAHNLIKITLTGTITDVSSAGQIYIPIPDEFAGQVVEIRAALNGAITGGNATLTAKIGGVAMTNGTVTIVQSGSAAGDVATGRPTRLNDVSAGQAIEIETNGGSTGTVSVFVTVVIRR